ncbi:hypothetical protein QE429_001398 [Bacillus sp. SORGH_AS 510]|uniref:hypothetical protein n=1 Tax=Bacillus sp. SORGH_AS_0510 TaxID=3041771 RepID=UPI0027809182|nr:hypothetical protein [Bacillus sp. SORGH_AS_0510]MDQ1144571.1 hypothetical protein [Bacillus sp. SORGH_AS_0510]
MEKVKLALNYALMLEMMKAKGFDNPTIVDLLNEGNEEKLESIGEGIPSWKTMVDFYQGNKEKCHQAITSGYEFSFMTKGSLKSLLAIKFGMKEGEDFIDKGEFLDQVSMTSENLQVLQDMISKNWTIVEQESSVQDKHLLKIELTYKPKFNIN